MDVFINTMDILGDTTVSKSFIEGTLVEFNDNEMRDLSDYAFYKLDALRRTKLPGLITVGAYAFSNCSSLMSADFPNATDIGEGAFDHCDKLEYVNLPKAQTIQQQAFSHCSKLKRLILPKITRGSSQMCSYCHSLKEADFRKMTSCDSDMFLQATSFTTLVLGSESVFALSSVDVFKDTNFAAGKSGGTLIVSRALITEYQNDANWAYLLSSNPNNRILALEDYTIDGTSTGDIDWSSFSVARMFLEGTLKEFTKDNITSMPSYMMSNNIRLRSVNLPNLTNVDNYAFEKCTALTSVCLPEVIILGTSAFYECTMLNSVDLPSCTNIGHNSFFNCFCLRNVNAPLVEEIYTNAFTECHLLKSMSLTNVIKIDGYAFKNCYTLEFVKLPATPPTVVSSSFSGINTECIFYVPTGSLSAYQADSNWSIYTTTYSFVEEDRE